jgi:uncharacterized protein (UPF0548 family)
MRVSISTLPVMDLSRIVCLRTIYCDLTPPISQLESADGLGGYAKPDQRNATRAGVRSLHAEPTGDLNLFQFSRPTPTQIDRFLATQAELPFTYGAVGATATTPPTGFDCDHARVLLGHDNVAFRAACSALRSWTQFDLGWTAALPRDTPIETDRCVAVVARALGLWTLNAARIVYVVTSQTQFGFAYGTLPGHVERGEERFLIELDPTTGDVWYDILAFSLPHHALARLGYPLVRKLQARFRQDSAKAMQRAVAAAITDC